MTNSITWACVRHLCRILSRVLCWVWLVCLWFIVNELEIDKSKVAEILMCVCIRMGHGGYGHMLCNVAIFLRKIVSCTSYDATLWDSVVGYGVFPRRFYSDCTDQFLFCQQNNYFLDVNSLSHYY